MRRNVVQFTKCEEKKINVETGNSILLARGHERN